MQSHRGFFQGIRERFLSPPGDEWFEVGLVIQSASARTASAVYPRLSQIFPRVEWDLLSRQQHPGFRFVYRIKRPLGGLRLLFSARWRYEIVALFHSAADRDLRLHFWLALLLMRPRRFFVFIEGGDGFWLAAENAQQIGTYLDRLWGLRRKRQAVVQCPGRVAEQLRGWGRAINSAVRGFLLAVAAPLARGLWAIWLGLRWLGLFLFAVTGFLLAIVLLGFFRLFYDTYYYRYRFFSKAMTLHPSRKLTQTSGAPEPSAQSREMTTP